MILYIIHIQIQLWIHLKRLNCGYTSRDFSPLMSIMFLSYHTKCVRYDFDK